MVFRTALCHHCRQEPATRQSSACAHHVCEPCHGNAASCPEPRARRLRLGMGQRLASVDPEGKLAMVSGWLGGWHILDLAAARFLAPPCKLPRSYAAVVRVSRSGRLVWPHYRSRLGGGLVFHGFRAAWLHERGASPIDLPAGQRPIPLYRYRVKGWPTPLEPVRWIQVCREARLAWRATRAETVWIFDVDTGRARELRGLLQSEVAQSVSLDSKTELLVTGTHGRVRVHRVDSAQALPLGSIALPDADTPWVAAAGQRIAVVSDHRGTRGYALHVFGQAADATVAPTPILTWAEADPAGRHTGARRLQRPITACLSDDGRFLAVAMADRRIAVHDLDGGSTQLLHGHEDRICLLHFSDDARALIAGDHLGRVIIRPRRARAFVDVDA